MSIIGIILGVIAIGLVFWLRKDQKIHFDLHEGDIHTTRHAYEALMSDFNNCLPDVPSFRPPLKYKSKNDLGYNITGPL